MQISFEVFILVFFIVGTTIAVGAIVTNDRIIRDVCRRENRPYSILWLYSPHWQWRIFKLSWFREAKLAGYGREHAFFLLAWLCFLAICIVLVAAGFVVPSARNIKPVGKLIEMPNAILSPAG